MTDRRTIDVYQAKARDYVAMGLSGEQAGVIADFVARLPRPALVLDLGCGPGIHAAEMMRAGVSVDAVDATPAFVAEAQGRGVPARLAGFEDITGTDLYDGIWASFSLLHARKADVPRHIDALATALKPGGVLYLGMKLGEGEERDSIGRHYSYFSEEELVAMLGQVRMNVVFRATGRDRGLSGEIAPYIHLIADA